ncbi:hypothetical protein FB451DRAFT_1191679 [Mycena latifolia]|nr:hypothetical protein FB451DRAFT_1191679 [Mycena latifolia]
MTHPPLTSKYEKPLTLYQIETQRRAERNEKSRIRMAQKRAELKARPLEEQEEAAERERGYQAKYRERHRRSLRLWESLRRLALYEERYGSEACAEYEKAMLERKKTARARRKAKARAREPYHSGDERDAVANGDVADC